MKTTVIGAFPKISDDPGGQELRRALHRFDRGEIDAAALDEVFDTTTRAAIAELEAAGIDVINDGHIRWDDLFAPFARAGAACRAARSSASTTTTRTSGSRSSRRRSRLTVAPS